MAPGPNLTYRGHLRLTMVRSILDAYHRAKTQRPHAKSRHGFFQCDKNATSAKQIAYGAQELCILRLLRLPCAIYSFILFQQARAVLFETAQ
jgi:hypothetical protein